MNLGLIIIIILLIMFLKYIVSLFSFKPIPRKRESTKVRISKNYPDIVKTIQLSNKDNNAFRWSKIWVSDWFGKYAKIISDSSLGYIKANYHSHIVPEISSFYTYSIEISVKENVLVFAVRNIYYDNSSYRNEQELDTHVNNNFNYMVKRYMDFIQANCSPGDFNKSSQNVNISKDLFSFYRNLLGLKINFTDNELKQAYREAVAKFHPDRYTKTESRNMDNAEILMKQINEAYEVLKKYAV